MYNVIILTEPSVPYNCSSKPVYSSDGDLTFIEFSWTQVDVSDTVNQWPHATYTKQA